MEDIMFKLFERQPNWTLRQLIQETDQPEVCFLLIYFLPNFYNSPHFETSCQIYWMSACM